MNPILPRVLPFAVFIAFIAAAIPLNGVAPSLGMDPRWWYAIRIGIVTVLLAWFWRSYVELKPAGGVRRVDWAVSVVVGIVVFVLWINLNFKPLTFGDAPGFDPRADGAIDWGLALTRLAGATLVVPVMEELFWRSLVLRWIHKPEFLSVDPQRVGFRALLISSALFAVEHHLWFAGLLAGLAYGWLYMRTGNLWIPIASHAVTNGLLGAWVLYTGAWQFW
jgi:CAAX prenyl protease-like protein